MEATAWRWVVLAVVLAAAVAAIVVFEATRGPDTRPIPPECHSTTVRGHDARYVDGALCNPVN